MRVEGVRSSRQSHWSDSGVRGQTVVEVPLGVLELSSCRVQKLNALNKGKITGL